MIGNNLITRASPLLTTSALDVRDDVTLSFGNSKDASIIYETADGNAKVLMFLVDESDDSGNNIPAFVFSEETNALNADLGLLDGLVEGTVVVLNNAGDAYASLDAGDDNVATAKGLAFYAAADEDVEIINLTNTTGTPRIFWDESENAITTVTPTFDLDQGANDGRILGMRSSDVAHGVTSEAPTDVYATFAKTGANDGGLSIRTFTDSGTVSCRLYACGQSDNTAKTSSGEAPIMLYGLKKSSTSFGDTGADGNILAILRGIGGGDTKFLFDEDGDAHADVEWTEFDEYDDLALVDTLEQTLANKEVLPTTEEREFLEGTEIIGKDSWHFEDGKLRAMVNMTRLAQLHHGALRQVYRRIQGLEQKLLY